MSVLPVAPGRMVLFFCLGRHGRLRKVKWAGQGHRVGVSKMGFTLRVFNRLLLRYLRDPAPGLPLCGTRHLSSFTED